MFDAILKILSVREAVLGSFHVSKEEFFFIKEFLDDAIHLVYAQEKNHSREGDLKRNETWQAVYGLTKDWLIKCTQMMTISHIRTYENNQVQSNPVYLIQREMIDALLRVSNRLNSVYGLADGEAMQNILHQLREREQQLRRQVDEVQAQTQTEAVEQDFYQVDG